MPAYLSPKWDYERCRVCDGHGGMVQTYQTQRGEQHAVTECSACRGDGIIARRKAA